MSRTTSDAPRADTRSGGGAGTTTLTIAGPPVELIATAMLTDLPTRPSPSVAPPPQITRPPVTPTAPPPTELPPTAAPEAGAGPGWLLPLGVLVIGMFMSVLDTSIVNIALPSIRRDFGATADSAQWISTAYGLTEGVAVTVSAWLGTRMGNKRLYIWSIGLFTVFSALCGISGSITEMVIFRILQAIPGGMIPVTCTILIYRMVPRAQIGAAMGLYGLGIVVAPGVGPILGGYFVEYLSWPYIYWVNVPIGIVATIAAVFVLKEMPAQRGTPFDKVGFGCIAVGLFAGLLAFEKGSTWGWDSYAVLGLLFLAANSVLVWVVIELQVEHPLLDVRVFRNPTYAKSMMLIGIVMVSLFAMLFYLPQFLQNVQGLTAWNTGLMVLPQAAVMVVVMPLAGRLYDVVGARWPAVVGMALTSGGMYLLSGLNIDITRGQILVAQAVVAAGVGLAIMPVMTGALAALPSSLSESASALNTVVQRVSQSFGIALLSGMILTDKAQLFADRSSMVVSRGVDVDPQLQQMVNQGSGGLTGLWQIYQNQALTSTYSNAFLITSGLALVGVVVAVLLPGGRPVPTAGGKPAMH